MHSAFADTPESHAWFEALATVSNSEKQRIEIPDSTTWRNWLRYVEVPDEDLEEVISTTPTVENEPMLLDILQRGAALMIRYMGEIKNPYRFAALSDINHPHYRYFYAQLLTTALPFVRSYNQSLGIPDKITQFTVADLGRNMRVHRKREGIGGLGTMWWLGLHFCGIIYQLGRLQFERRLAGKEIALSMQANGINADASTPVLSIHIPDYMGPMDRDACSESISLAVEFYNQYFPNWPVHYGQCHSWLLDPQLKEILKPTSNIVHFQDRFVLSDEISESSESVMQFVFGKHVRDIDEITAQSSLERGIITHLRSGREWNAHNGWFVLPSKSTMYVELTSSAAGVDFPYTTSG